MRERLQKILSSRGMASRRKAEEYIEAGFVKVNGKVAKLGDKADPTTDKIEVDGRVLSDRKEMLYYVLHKPVGILTENLQSSVSLLHQQAATKGAQSNVLIRWDTLQGEHGGLKRQGANSRDDQRFDPLGNLRAGSAHHRRGRLKGQEKLSRAGSKTVYDLLPDALKGKIFPVGRLDKDSSGLLLFTNDGVLAYRLTHPKFNHDKEYEAVLDRPISPSAWEKIEEGMMLDGSMTKPLTVKKTAPNRIRITLTEGRNRQIRRMLQHIGYTVKGLRRVRIMTLSDDILKSGEVRALIQAERVALLGAVGL